MNVAAEPTTGQCSNRERVPLADGRTGMACWYPQMGGYVGRAVIAPSDGCLEVWVWHDGAFPFGGTGEYPVLVVDENGWLRDGVRGAVRLHHCDPGQFIAFGQMAQQFLDESAGRVA